MCMRMFMCMHRCTSEARPRLPDAAHEHMHMYTGA